MSKVYILAPTGEINEKEVDDVFFFNQETHGSAKSLVERAHPADTRPNSVAFINAATADVVIIDSDG